MRAEEIEEKMKFLVVLDLSEISPLVVKGAIQFAKMADAEVRVLHVAEPEPYFDGSEIDTEVMRDCQAERFHKEHRQVQEYADQFEAAGLKASALLIQGVTIKTIFHEAERFKADLIVMGTHKKGLLSRIVLGSTSEGILHDSDIPTLIIPTHNQQA